MPSKENWNQTEVSNSISNVKLSHTSDTIAGIILGIILNDLLMNCILDKMKESLLLDIYLAAINDFINEGMPKTKVNLHS